MWKRCLLAKEHLTMLVASTECITCQLLAKEHLKESIPC